MDLDQAVLEGLEEEGAALVQVVQAQEAAPEEEEVAVEWETTGCRGGSETTTKM